MNSIKTIGIFSTSLLAAASAIYIYSPVIGTYANNFETTDVNVSVNEVMSVMLNSNELILNAIPNSFTSGVITVTSSTNSQYGYTLTIEDEDNSSDITHIDPNVEDKITSISSEKVTSSEMEDNTWGFSLDATDFYKIPANGSPVALKRTSTPTTAAGETTDVTIGAKVGTITSGTYADEILFTIYVNGQNSNNNSGNNGSSNCTNIFCISNMQEMTPEICETTTTPSTSAAMFDWNGSHLGDTNYIPRTILTDTRDGNRYLISKLADGSCWMSQNLALDLTANVPLTNETTDLNTKTSWTPENTTNTTVTRWATNNATASSTDHSYHPIASDSYYQGGTTKSNSPTEASNQYLWESTGNYYNWFAATAGSGTYTKITGSANDSICPKGWRLPLAGPSADVKYSYGLLTTSYNGASSLISVITSEPLVYLRAGMQSYTGSMYRQEEIGYYWSATEYPNDNDNAYYLGFSDRENTIFYRPLLSKGQGCTMRCVAR